MESEEVFSPIITLDTHKTTGINAIEWRRLFGFWQFVIDELRDNISNMSYQVPGSPVSLDVPAAAVNLPITYRQFLRTCFKAFEEATNGGNGIDVNDELTYPSLKCFEALAMIPQGEKDIIIKGVPL